MPCCGQNREKARMAAEQAPAQPRIPREKPAPGPALRVAAPVGPAARLRYTGTVPITVRAPQSGRSYSFSGREPERTVDRRDVEALLKTGLFRRAG